MTSAIVGIDDSYGDRYKVYFPHDAEPVKMVEVFKDCHFFYRSGSFATRLLRKYKKSVLFSQNDHANLMYELNLTNNFESHNLYLYSISDKKRLYNGLLCRFYEWCRGTNELMNAVGKLVSFQYDGGSQSGKRYILLEAVEGTGSGTLLKGRDLIKNEFRSYKVSKISGQVEILN